MVDVRRCVLTRRRELALAALVVLAAAFCTSSNLGVDSGRGQDRTLRGIVPVESAIDGSPYGQRRA